MKPKTLKDLYVDGLKDLYSAESQILKALPKLVKAAGDPDLKRSFQQHEKQTREHVIRLERICESLDVSPKGKKCVGMEGLLKEGAEFIKEKPKQDVLDAGLISAAQHVEHYEIAGYGTARTWAELLEHQDHAKLLQQTLDEERETDKHLTRLAEASINQEARNDASDKVAAGSSKRRSSAAASRPRADSQRSAD